MAENTRVSYNVGLKRFSEIRTKLQLPQLWPPDVSHIVQFIAYLSLNKAAHATVRLYLTAISFKCKMLGSADPTKEFIVQKMLEGVRRSNPGRDQRLPITTNLLKDILSKLPLVCTSLYESKMFSAAFTLAFHGFLRVGEITLHRNNCDRVLSVHDIKIEQMDKLLKVHIRYSKTDQSGQGTVIKIIGSGDAICPFKCMTEYLACRPRCFDGQLFKHFNGQALTRYQFSAVLKKALSFIGIEYSNYKSHSFRIGAATCAAERGVSVAEIQKAGRWKSNAVYSYIRK